MALFTTTPTQQALSPMDQLLQITKKKSTTSTPLTLLTPEEQQQNLGTENVSTPATTTTTAATTTTPVAQKSPMEQLLQTQAGASETTTQQAASGVAETPTSGEQVAATDAAATPKATPKELASQKAWDTVNNNKDWWGPNARHAGEGDLAWHDRLMQEAQAEWSPAMETKYDDAGRPVEVGYYDWDGNWVQTRDMTPLNDAIKGLQDATDNLPETIDIQNTDEYKQLEELKKKLSDPATSDEDMAAAENQAATQMGLTVQELRDKLQQMTDQEALGIGGQTGMTTGEISEFDRKTALERQDILKQGQDLMQQAMGKSGGSSIAASSARNTIIGTLATFQAQKDAQQTELDWTKKNAEYAALTARNDQLFNQKQLTAGQYLDSIKENRTLALQATFGQLEALAQQNQTEISKYSAIASARYQEVMAQLGVLQGVSEQELSDYEKWLAPMQHAMEVAAAKAQQDQQTWNNILGVIGTAVSIIAAIPTGGASLIPGAAAAGAAAAGATAKAPIK